MRTDDAQVAAAARRGWPAAGRRGDGRHATPSTAAMARVIAMCARDVWSKAASAARKLAAHKCVQMSAGC